MKIGLVGYKSSGKSSLFRWLTGQVAAPALVHSSQSATALLPEPRFKKLIEIYNPKKITHATIEIVDTPGLSRDQQGNPARLGQLRETDALIWVVPVFDGSDTLSEIGAFKADVVIADLEIVCNRMEKIQEQNRRPVPKSEHERLDFEYETLRLLQEGLENGNPLRDDQLTPEQQKLTRGFRLLSGKPRMLIINTADDEVDLKQYSKYAEADIPAIAVSVRLELELEQMNEQDKKAFLDEMQLPSTHKSFVLKSILDASGQMTFMTAGEKELRTWLIPKNGTAIDAAAAIHTDMAKGFIRAEVMDANDLIKLGNERAVKAANLVRRESKDYIVKDSDILLFHFS
ncbi:MAG: DUF933 domain-containing protein [Planctomycetaceae bacterium]|jgi:ribosome-binding ATPase YchF (GTP1/OBG family)|nr:DUF933 domain-containing protein [Planctomycetaceae bacterium]